MNDRLCSGCWNGLCRLGGSFGYLNPQRKKKKKTDGLYPPSLAGLWLFVMILFVIALDIITGNWALFQRDSFKRTDYSWRKTTWPLNNPGDKNRGAVAAGPHTGALREPVFRSFVYRREREPVDHSWYHYSLDLMLPASASPLALPKQKSGERLVQGIGWKPDRLEANSGSRGTSGD